MNLPRRLLRGRPFVNPSSGRLCVNALTGRPLVNPSSGRLLIGRVLVNELTGRALVTPSSGSGRPFVRLSVGSPPPRMGIA